MEVYVVGNDAAIVIAPLDRDECPAREEEGGRWAIRAAFVPRCQSRKDRRGSGNPLPLLGQGWRVITTSRN